MLHFVGLASLPHERDMDKGGRTRLFPAILLDGRILNMYLM
jgi:hypothetical protein